MNFLVIKPKKLVGFRTEAVAISSADVTLPFVHLALFTLLEFDILIAAKKRFHLQLLKVLLSSWWSRLFSSTYLYCYD